MRTLQDVGAADPLALHDVLAMPNAILDDVRWQPGERLDGPFYFRRGPGQYTMISPRWRKIETPPESLKQGVRRVVADWLEDLADRVRCG